MYDPRVMTVATNYGAELSISAETDSMVDDPNPNLFPQFLFVPNVTESEHWHLSMTVEQARALRDWLDVYLRGIEHGRM